MRRHILSLSALIVLSATTACSEGQDLATRAEDCAALAQDVAASGLEDTPTQQEAEQAVNELNQQIDELTDSDLQQAATMLRDRLREVQEAAAGTDTAEVEQAADEAREAARDVAETCGLPVDEVLGQ